LLTNARLNNGNIVQNSYFVGQYFKLFSELKLVQSNTDEGSDGCTCLTADD